MEVNHWCKEKHNIFVTIWREPFPTEWIYGLAVRHRVIIWAIADSCQLDPQNKLQLNLKLNLKFCIQQNAFQNAFCKTWVILYRPQGLNIWHYITSALNEKALYLQPWTSARYIYSVGGIKCTNIWYLTRFRWHQVMSGCHFPWCPTNCSFLGMGRQPPQYPPHTA